MGIVDVFLNGLNELWYLYRRNNWLLDPSWFLRDFEHTIIDRPIFLLGNQGGGLTLISRMLRRNPEVVSVTGNNSYWSGADELQNVYGLILPAELTGIKYKAPYHPVLTPPRSWSYASDALIAAYRKTEKDYSPEIEFRFKRILKYIITKHGTNGTGRFIDKSQVFSVKLGLIYSLLKECKPKFLLVLRSPYIECPRAAMGKAGDMRRYATFLSWEERLDICMQHWNNSISAIIEDKERLPVDIMIARFEDILQSPERELRKICAFLELNFDQDMLPQQYHSLPFGSHYRNRWYPLRSDVNIHYKDVIKRTDLDRIEERCGDLAKQFGYSIPF